MPSTFLKPTKVVNLGLGLLLREQTVSQLIWRLGLSDFVGASGDTVSIRVPAYATARQRALRSGAARVKDQIHERKVDVTLDLDIYKDIGISDEQLTLDIANFGEQVLNPVMQGVAISIEDEVAATIAGTTFFNVLTHSIASADAYDTLIDARVRLNNAFVPSSGRFVLAGSDFAADALKSERLIDASRSGDTGALRDASIGRIAGFDIIESNVIPANRAYAMHRTAFAMVQAAPVVPAGAPWGATSDFQGNAIRTVRVFDPDLVEDRLVVDSWVGVSPVNDTGHFTAAANAGGRWVPVVDPAAPITGQTPADLNDLPRMVRGVQINVTA